MNPQKEIYYAAQKNNNDHELSDLINNYSIDIAPIDTLNFNRPPKKDTLYYWSAAAQLAFKGMHEAVERLRELGASTNLIAFGYAMGGHHEQVERYRDQFDANINWISMGYAMGGYHQMVEYYRKHHSADANWIACGCAMGGHHKQVEQYRDSYSVNSDIIAFGYARSGYQQQVEQCRIDLKASIDWIACGYATGGHHKQVEQYRNTHGANINLITCGYAIGGHEKQFKHYRREHRADLIWIIIGNALGGHHKQVEYYCKNQLVKYLDTYVFELDRYIDSSFFNNNDDFLNNIKFKYDHYLLVYHLITFAYTMGVHNLKIAKDYRIIDLSYRSSRGDLYSIYFNTNTNIDLIAHGYRYFKQLSSKKNLMHILTYSNPFMREKS